MTPRPGMRGSESQDEERRQRRGLLAWFVLVLFSICILFACAQIAGLSIFNPPQSVDLRSNMQADYSPWGYVAFGPINPQILLDILDDLNLDQLQIPVISNSCLIPGSCPTATATPEPTQTDTPTITLTPSETPTPSQTPTITNTLTLTPTATKTPTPTPLVYPVKLANPDKVDPELTQNVRFTILVINYGSLPPAQLQTVCDFLPTGLTYVAGSADRGGTYGTCPGVGGTAIVWTPNESIPQGAFSRFTFQARSDHPVAGDSFDNRVTAFGGNFNAATNHKSVYAYTPTPTPTETTQPITAPDLYSADEDTNINPGALAGVLANDSDAPWDILQSYVVVGPTYGDLTLNTDGSFNYQTTPDWNGYDSFVYEACDGGGPGLGACSTAAVTLAVTPVPDAPRALDDTYSPTEDTLYSRSAPGVLTNDYDPDILTGPANIDLTVEPTPLATPKYGDLALNSDGSFTYRATPDFFGTPDYFDYQVCDGPGSCDTGRANLNVVNVNDPPVANPDGSLASSFADTDEDMPITLDVLANDTDPDNLTAPFNAGLTVGGAASWSSTQGGTVTNNGSDVTYAPPLNYFGNDSFTYRAFDGIVDSNLATVYVTVNPIDDPPVGADDTYTTPISQFVSTPFPLFVLTNDTDPVEGDPLHIENLVAPTAKNVVTIQSAPNALLYDPDPSGTGYHSPTVPDVFDYQVCDTNTQGAATQTACDTASVSVIVNDPPVATPDAYSVDEDTTLTIPDTSTPTPVSGVLANDSDPNGDPVTSVLDSNPSHASSFTFNADGSFNYHPALNYNGSDSFTYHDTDGGLTSATVTVDLTVNPVNDAPEAVNDTAVTDVDTSLAIDVLANDTDVDGSPDPSTVAIVATPTAGTITGVDAGTGAVTYQPNAGYVGPDTFTYTVYDDGSPLPAMLSNVATVSVTVNGPPVAVDDPAAPSPTPAPYSVTEDTPFTLAAPGLLDNDSDPNGDPLTVMTPAASGPSHAASFVLNANGSFSYTPELNYNGADSFTYYAYDGRLASITPATVYLNVTPVDDPPVANNDPGASPPPNPSFYQTDEDSGTLSVTAAHGIKVNDMDPEGDAFSVDPTPVSPPSNGSLTLYADGSFDYTPDPNFNGTDTFAYQDCEDTFPPLVCSTVPGIVTITVNPINDPPVASPDSYPVGQAGSLAPTAPGVLANDTDVDGDPLTAVLDSGPSHDPGFVLNADGSFSYSPDLTFHGLDTFTYHANDGTDDSNTTTVSILVDDVPAAVDDSYATNEDTTLDEATPGILGNDTDPNSDALTATKLTDPAHGSVTVNANGSFSYTPASNYNSPMGGDDSFTYEACDPYGLCDSATVTITINPVNDAPTAVADGPYYTYDNPGGPEDNSPVAPLDTSPDSVLDNDGDFDGPLPLHAVLVDPPDHAYSLDPVDFELKDDGTFVYNAADGYFGPDSFTYQACDSFVPAACSSTTTVNLYVDSLPVANDDPATPGGYTIDEDTTLNVGSPGVLGNDTDANSGDTLAAVLDAPPAHAASFNLYSDGSFDYQPDPDWNGTDSFTYHVNDGYFELDD